MIVEDLAFNAEVNRAFLKRCDVEVIYWATNGKDAVNYYKQYQYNDYINLILMDIEMPIMDGKEAVLKIIQYEKEKNLPESIIVFLSGNCIEKEIKECIDPKGSMRAHAFLRKPTAFGDFQHAIDGVKRKFIRLSTEYYDI